MKLIPLQYSDIKALVDDEDFDNLVVLGEWRLNAQGYVSLSSDYIGKKMHHYILGERPEGFECDHANRVRHDNQRHNISYVTRLHNLQNKERGSSRYLGVSYDCERNKYRAQIRAPHKINLGRFESEIEAAQVYDQAALTHHGPTALLNFPQESRAIHQFMLEQKRSEKLQNPTH